MRSLVKLKTRSFESGFSLIEVMIALGISIFVLSLASAPLLNYIKHQRISSEKTVISTLEGDIFSWLSTTSTCEQTLGGIDTSVPQIIPSIKIKKIDETSLVILTPGTLYYPGSNIRVQGITTNSLVSTGVNQGLIQVNFEIKTPVDPILDRTRSFVVKVFTNAAGVLTTCSRNAVQDLQGFCDSFSGTLTAANLCRDIAITGNSTVQNQLLAETNLVTTALNAPQATVTTTSTLGNTTATNNIQIANTLTGAAATITVSNQTSTPSLNANNAVCTNTVNCRTFINRTCGAVNYVSKIATNGDLTCVPRPW